MAKSRLGDRRGRRFWGPTDHPAALRRNRGHRRPSEAGRSGILLLYLDKRGRPKVRIHGRPRSDRKRSFLLSAVAPSTSTRHPREARPINGAQRGGLASGGEGKCLLTPRPHFTAHHARLVTRWLVLRTALLVRQERRPTRLCRTPGAGSGLL